MYKRHRADMDEIIKLEHGGGGTLMKQLIEETIIPAYTNKATMGGIGLPGMDDGATIPLGDGHLVFTTDAHTVRPLFWPGGDIGKLSICGTVNDVVMMGAEPLALSSALILEEGLRFSTLKRVLESMNTTMNEVGIPIVAGDTKIVERGGADQLMTVTSGVGYTDKPISDAGLQPEDKIILTGSIGNHQMSLLVAREELKLDSPIMSDMAPLWGMLKPALKTGGITSMKDPTRGGVSGAFNEMASKSAVTVNLHEERIPIKDNVRSACDLLGLDPLELANEGIAVMGVHPDNAEEVLNKVRGHRYGVDAEIVGEVVEGPGRVVLETYIGGRRIVRPPLGSPMPRIC
jgi:hydrogenase expression/formation protein HypE